MLISMVRRTTEVAARHGGLINKILYPETQPGWAAREWGSLVLSTTYLSNQGMNSISFLMMTVIGDDQNIFPYITDFASDRTRIDVSKMAQWEITFEHADKMGMFLHFKTQETENDQLLDGGAIGNERARFSHHLARMWNLGEEIINTIAEVKSFINFVQASGPVQASRYRQ
jgi:hypothetical protein